MASMAAGVVARTSSAERTTDFASDFVRFRGTYPIALEYRKYPSFAVAAQASSSCGSYLLPFPLKRRSPHRGGCRSFGGSLSLNLAKHHLTYYGGVGVPPILHDPGCLDSDWNSSMCLMARLRYLRHFSLCNAIPGPRHCI